MPAIGQPVIIPGSMGTASWVLVGQPGSMEHSFGTTCHGAGRMMSRTAAVKLAAGRRIDKELDAIGIIARARGHKGLAEEQPAAYKDVDHVVEVVDKVGHLQESRPAAARRSDQGLIRSAIPILAQRVNPRVGEPFLNAVSWRDRARYSWYAGRQVHEVPDRVLRQRRMVR